MVGWIKAPVYRHNRVIFLLLNMLCIEDVRALCTDDVMVLTEHLLTRMRQRDIRLEDIKYAITTGEIIKQYPADYPFPSCLINAGNMHIVCSIGEGVLYLITAYRPSRMQWEDGGRKRKGGIP